MLKTEKSGTLNESKSQTPQSRWLRIERAVIYAGVSRTFLYGLLNRRSVASHIVGRVRLVDRESLDAFISAAEEFFVDAFMAEQDAELNNIKEEIVAELQQLKYLLTLK